MTEAAARFGHRLRSRPTMPPGIAALGEVLLYQGQVDDALTELRRAVELAPQDPGNHAALAKALSAKGLTAEAEEEMRRRSRGRSRHGQLVVDLVSEFRLKHILQLLRCSRFLLSCALAAAPPAASAGRPAAHERDSHHHRHGSRRPSRLLRRDRRSRPRPWTAWRATALSSIAPSPRCR